MAGYPDVATVGSRFDIVHYGKHRLIGGTSASTPTFGAIVSLLNDLRFLKGQRSMGFINPFLYWAAQQDARAFTPVTKGHNQRGCCAVGYHCAAHWDPLTGLGTPNFPVLSRLALRAGDRTM